MIHAVADYLNGLEKVYGGVDFVLRQKFGSGCCYATTKLPVLGSDPAEEGQAFPS